MATSVEADMTDCTVLPGGRDLSGGGRVELLEATLDDESHAWLFVYGVEFPELDSFALAFDRPGASQSYRLGPLEVTSDAISITFTEHYEEYPCTDGEDFGDDEACETLIEERSGTYRCEKDEQEWVCGI